MPQLLSRAPNLAFVGSYVPRQCGIATFTHDSRAAVLGEAGVIYAPVVAVENEEHPQQYAHEVAVVIRRDRIEDYASAAAQLSLLDVDAVNLQHEFGLFGGEAGAHILHLVEALDVPLITTLHTVLETPDPMQRHVTEALVRHSARLLVMTKKAADILQRTHPAARVKTIILPHGIPNLDLPPPALARTQLGLPTRATLLSFGLLSPNKGLEVMIDGLPDVVRETPDVNYVILGATHPDLVRREGEAYRNGLRSRVAMLGVQANVTFVNRYTDLLELCAYLAAADIFVTPYLNATQATSGALAYSYGLGKPVVSTPYWHAEELLADGRGILVPFADPRALAEGVSTLFRNDQLRAAMACQAYADGKAMRWPVIGLHLARIAAEVTMRAPLPAGSSGHSILRSSYAGKSRGGRPQGLPELIRPSERAPGRERW
jgi:glycosyltransferase involved in cell wall biosynthesis|tara:strand:+ start:29542 stop:30837 length:1296 start_codon:yes stop_codon:yes gene_type:complete